MTTPDSSSQPARPEVPGDLRGTRAVVMGLGRFGGGEAAARHLVGQGASVVVTDLGAETEFKDSLARLASTASPAVDLSCWSHQREAVRA